MPALAGVDVAARIAELVEQHRPELEQIADVELDRALDEQSASTRTASSGGST